MMTHVRGHEHNRRGWKHELQSVFTHNHRGPTLPTSGLNFHPCLLFQHTDKLLEKLFSVQSIGLMSSLLW